MSDLIRFEAHNDHHGSLRGDEAIRVLAGALRSAASRVGDGSTFASDRRTGA